MILLTIFILIILYSINFLRNFINSVLFRRIGAISFLYASVLTLNTLYIQSIGYGIGIYSGLFQVNVLTNLTSIFIFLISSIIILSWPNINTYLNPSFCRVALPNKEENLNEKNEISSCLNKKVEGIHHTGEEEYSILILFSLLGAIFLISSSDLLSFYLSIELQSFGVYILASLYREKVKSTSAGLKYFLLGGLSSCLILLGSGIIYSYTGLTNFESIFDIFSIIYNYTCLPPYFYEPSILNFLKETESLDKNFLFNSLSAARSAGNTSYLLKNSGEVLFGLTLGIIFIISGFLFKIAAAPFHNWSPDVYDDCPTIVTIWLTIMPKISILVFILSLVIGLNINYSIIEDFKGILPGIINTNIVTSLLLLSSLLSLIIGAVLGLNQIRIKRLLAYSTINHVGFLLLCLAVFLNTSQPQSLEAFIFYIFQYTITNLNVFLILLAFGYISNINTDSINHMIDKHSLSPTFFSGATREEDTHRLKSNSVGAPYDSTFRPVSEEKVARNIKLSLVTLDINYIKTLKGMFFKNPLLSLSLSLSLFSFAGVPPLIGFFAKQQVLYSSISSGFFFISIIAIIVSVISASYYLKIIKVMTSPILIESDNKNNVKGASVKNYLIFPYGSVICNIHCFIIGVLTISLVFFIFNPEIILNSIAIIANFILDLKNV